MSLKSRAPLSPTRPEWSSLGSLEATPVVKLWQDGSLVAVGNVSHQKVWLVDLVASAVKVELSGESDSPGRTQNGFMNPKPSCGSVRLAGVWLTAELVLHRGVAVPASGLMLMWHDRSYCCRMAVEARHSMMCTLVSCKHGWH